MKESRTGKADRIYNSSHRTRRVFLVLLSILAAVAISGCVGGTVKTDGNNGLIVNSFSADPVQAEADDAVRFFLDVENVGGTTATCITSELFGVDSWRDELGMPITTFAPLTRGLGVNIRNGVISVCGFYTVDYACFSYDTNNDDFGFSGFFGNSFSSFTNQICPADAFTSSSGRAGLTKFQPDLIPPNPSLGRAGQSFIPQWILRPPVLPEGVKSTFPVTARTSFFYKTNAQVNIQTFNKAEFKRRADLGQQTDYPLAMENSFGSPIQIAAVRGSSPIVVNTEALGGLLQRESYVFEFINLGQGFPLPIVEDRPGSTNPGFQSGFVETAVTINGPGAAFSDCLGQSGTTIFLGGQTLADLVQLRSDQTVPVSCQIVIDKAKWRDTPIGTISLTFSLWYRYYIDRTVNVEVIGVEGLSNLDAGLGNVPILPV